MISVPHGVLVYRAENGRIVAELEAHARRAGTSVARLADAEDDREVQALLHRLLIVKASDAEGPVFQELQRHAKQTEPLLISSDGVVVNGNRRLSAMRELLAHDPVRYADFALVAAAVLPAEAEEADYDFIEAALQMAPDVKLAYGWVNRRMKLRRQTEELKLPLAEIIDAYRFESADQIKAEIEELSLAQSYLAYRGAPGAYEEVTQLEDLFVGLGAQLSRTPPRLRACWRAAGFAMIDGRSAIKGPMDRYFPFADPVPAALPEEALRRFSAESELSTTTDAEGPLSAAKLAEIEVLILRNSGRSAEFAAMLFDISEMIRAEHRDRRAPNAALKQMSRAKSALSELDIGCMSPKQLRRLQSELAAIQAQVDILLGEPKPTSARARAGFLSRLFQ
ncbi:hypothetical protein ACFQI3_11895 [Hansschlegelia quercus]|uniref:ParB/Sulfiredoxin domain-containing protein n=1 Tax=Hansschlegelia quercus TaxID=2528245 RepID=A0A4Q9GHC6_9HYPH|nr:hypothetical protein [Hansschlegelia quercus]TBN53442.1 hypothetical protein EYR15_10545 [Hansschlegelia quercus]